MRFSPSLARIRFPEKVYNESELEQVYSALKARWRSFEMINQKVLIGFDE